MSYNLDLLHRFYDHNDDDDDDVSWHISGGSLEGQRRHYRVLYEHGDTKHAIELVIDTGQPAAVYIGERDAFMETVQSWMAGAPREFVAAITKCFHTDPWLCGKYDTYGGISGLFGLLQR